MNSTMILFGSAIIVCPAIALAESPELSACMDNVDLGALKTQQWIACQT